MSNDKSKNNSNNNSDDDNKRVINNVLKALQTKKEAKTEAEQDAETDNIFVNDDWEEANYTCPKCHKKMHRRKRKPDFACPHCGHKENDEDKDKKQKEQELEARHNKCIHYFRHNSANTVRDITGKTFNNYDPKNDESKRAVETCKRMADAINNGQIVHGLISGPTGVGKTHLACAIINRLMVRSSYDFNIIFISINLLADLRKSGIDNTDIRRKVDRVINETAKANLVVIDDLGTEYNTEWNKSIVDKIMDFREDMNLIVTTNLNQDGEGNSFDRYSDRTKSRLRNHMSNKDGNYVVVFNDTEDYRTKGFA